MTTRVRAAGGAALSLGAKIGAGGEGAVYRINEQPASVAKIYARPLDARQVAKLNAMVSAADDPLRRVAAWPTALLYDDARAIGFTMPLLAAQRPLHELLGPRSRLELFPNAHWSFLIHTARNLARAFDVLHARNVVVGDVNSNNIVICGDSTARLIDCDSFQFPAGGALYRCNVGVPDYQPPELQQANFAEIDRLPEHDRFGLAVVIFQLLFVGKHPFAGVLPPGVPGDGAIGANVLARRYFYAPQARRRGLRPPPGSPTLASLTPQVAALFARAFLGEPATRPTAGEWESALEELAGSVVRCAQNPVHRHRRDARCPWCALDKRGLRYFLAPGARREPALDESIWEHVSNAEVEKRWAAIARVAPPPAIDPRLGPQARRRARPLRLWDARRRAAFAAGAAGLLAVLVGCVQVGRPIFALPFIALAGMLWALHRPDARTRMARLWRSESAAHQAYAAALRAWEREARGTRFLEARARLAQVRAELLDQRRRHDAEIAAVERARLRVQWAAFLENRVIADWHVRQIDARTRALLRRHGIVNAADVTRENLRRVPGLSRHAVLCLTVWRRSVEHEFAAAARTAAPNERAVHAVKLRHLRERAANWARLAGQETELRRLAAEIVQRRPLLRARACELVTTAQQAQADATISPLFYKTWT